MTFDDDTAALRDKLQVALEALRRIAASDPGPAYFIARSAIEEIEERENQSPSADSGEEESHP